MIVYQLATSYFPSDVVKTLYHAEMYSVGFVEKIHQLIFNLWLESVLVTFQIMVPVLIVVETFSASSCVKLEQYYLLIPNSIQYVSFSSNHLSL